MLDSEAEPGCSRGKARPHRRLIDVNQLQLVNALVADITELQHNLPSQFLLHVEIPQHRVRSFQVVLDACDVKGRFRCTGAKYRHAYTERNRQAGHDLKAPSWPDRILRQSFLEIVEGNRVVIDSKSRAEDRLASGNQREWRVVRERDARPKVVFRSVVDFSTRELRGRNKPEGRIECREAAFLLFTVVKKS